ncbi:MAG: bifunctional folylpolyglutamate synthase/dihydrofolate synthase [Betaproteobacteria bacterium RIFCSPLOWO2_02_FULL_67_26]|nr:MAG: bifunctional folylpolyglutamate synthase/dihydrofolate synthase [Betaproteobacteria bacterium RIFCSPLOWO2_02_FULL_67_26]
MSPVPTSLAGWLEYIERQHPQAIALGLDRVQSVKQALGLDPAFPIITVGGTNGKGSVCAMLESILHHAGYRIGCYTSPHLLRYNERVRVGRAEAPDEELVRGLAAVERERRDVALTYFEYGTLAAAWLFTKQRVDAAVLEVGLGGRLDAVNAFDADCAVVTTVDIDHVDFLGGDREAIGREKAGIFRRGRPAVCADPAPPASLTRHAEEIGAQLLRIGTDFGATPQARQWQYWGPRGKRNALPHPALRGTCQLGNAAAALTALECLRERLPVTMNDIRAGLLQAENPGRFQVLPGRPAVILDVAHNPQAARALAASLDAMGGGGRTLAVFAMLKDKDIAGVVAALGSRVGHWFIAGLGGPRGAPVDEVGKVLAGAAVGTVTPCDTVAAAYAQACDKATENDRILVFGSFYTVAAVMQLRASRARE